MPYASVSDVKSVAPYVNITADSKPSEGIVAGWITDEETILNSTLAEMGYITPVTGPKAITVLRKMIAHIVMARIMRARPNPESDPEAFQRRYDDVLKRLADPKDSFDLEDAEVNAGEVVIKDSTIRVSSNLRDLLNEEDRPRINRDQVF